MIIYMMRHGETDWNVQHLFQGRTDIPLNENGRKVADWTRDGLKDVHFDIAFCSPLCRAKETAQIILEGRDIELIEDERIIEMGFGEYEATSMVDGDEDIKTFFLHPDKYVDKKGIEPFETVLGRTNDFLNELIENSLFQDSTILVVSHGATLRGLIGAFKGIAVKDFWVGGVHKNCGMTIVEVNGKEKKILQEAIVLYDEKGLK